MDLQLGCLCGLVLAGCTPDWTPTLGSSDPLEVAHAFVHHRSFREAALRASLADPVREYGSLRLDAYTGRWDRLPVRNPTQMTETLPTTHEALVDLGREAFEAFPIDASRRWLDAWNGDPSTGIDAATLVLTPTPTGELPAETCASCHSAVVEGVRVMGLGNPALDLGPSDDPWPLGTVDPTPDDQRNPTTVADLRPIRHQSHLHWSATLHNSLPALAVRIDTLLITSHRQQSRPPRVIPVAIATYLWSLADGLPEPDPDHRGAEVFEGACASCHDLATSGPPIPASQVGTDRAATESSTRGTGSYRPPSLRGVGDRHPLLHDGSVATLEDLLSPDRIGGHPFGTDLEAGTRQDLMAFLGGL